MMCTLKGNAAPPRVRAGSRQFGPIAVDLVHLPAFRIRDRFSVDSRLTGERLEHGGSMPQFGIVSVEDIPHSCPDTAKWTTWRLLVMHHILDGTALDFVRSLGSPLGFDRVSAPWVELDRYLPEFPGDSATVVIRTQSPLDPSRDRF